MFISPFCSVISNQYHLYHSDLDTSTIIYLFQYYLFTYLLIFIQKNITGGKPVNVALIRNEFDRLVRVLLANNFVCQNTGTHTCRSLSSTIISNNIS